MPIHSWWIAFGGPLAGPGELTGEAARELESWVSAGNAPGARVAALRRDEHQGYEAVALECDVERPQDLAFPIKATELVAVLFALGGDQPRVLALREDFPDTPHQNWTPGGSPCSLCVDDRPWQEARLTATPADLVRRIQLWLAKAARGELHDAARPPDPLFFQNLLSLVIPAAALSGSGAPQELVGFIRPDNPGMIITQLEPSGRVEAPRFVVLSLRAAPQEMARLRHAPTSLAALADELAPRGIDILKELRSCVSKWAGFQNDNLRRLASRLAIVVAFPVQAGSDAPADDLRAFVTFESAGEIGVKLGTLARNNTDHGNNNGYLIVLNADTTARGADVRIEPADVHLAFDRTLAAAVADNSVPDRRRAVLVGAGAIGSQIAVNLSREGAFSWTAIDQDYLLPHNLARHSLYPRDVGAPKATAVAQQLASLLNEPVAAHACNVMAGPGDLKESVAAAFSEADVIIDASASVAVSRYLADLSGVAARRICAFFNPAGTAVVILSEGADRNVTLRELEAQYHGLHLSHQKLAGHLKVDLAGLRYSGSCRSLTNRIPATRAALLSAIAARGVRMALADEKAAIRVWTVSGSLEVSLVERDAFNVTQLPFAPWTITYDQGVLNTLARYRSERLPAETGGVLFGITDTSRRSIHVAYALPQPEDSRGSIQAFERGVSGLREEVARIAEASMHQLRYVGEWHSHPRGSSPMPSGKDIAQLDWLRAELNSEGLPAIMAIAADNGTFVFMLANGTALAAPSPAKPGNAV